MWTAINLSTTEVEQMLSIVIHWNDFNQDSNYFACNNKQQQTK